MLIGREWCSKTSTINTTTTTTTLFQTLLHERGHVLCIHHLHPSIRYRYHFLLVRDPSALYTMFSLVSLLWATAATGAEAFMLWAMIWPRCSRSISCCLCDRPTYSSSSSSSSSQSSTYRHRHTLLDYISTIKNWWYIRKDSRIITIINTITCVAGGPIVWPIIRPAQSSLVRSPGSLELPALQLLRRGAQWG